MSPLHPHKLSSIPLGFQSLVSCDAWRVLDVNVWPDASNVDLLEAHVGDCWSEPATMVGAVFIVVVSAVCTCRAVWCEVCKVSSCRCGGHGGRKGGRALCWRPYGKRVRRIRRIMLEALGP